jgi:DtxR family Mn-dependent transcriptional regulator
MPSNRLSIANNERRSSVVENYLLSLYILVEESRSPTLTQLAAYIRRLPLAEGLGTSLPTVLGVIRRMSRDGLLKVSAQKEIQLTENGMEVAASIARRHRLAERLVVDILGMELPWADQEAHMLEHGISSYLEGYINQALGNPITCPFGKPIPGSDYIKPRGKVVPMNMAKSGTAYRVISLPDEDPRLLKFLSDHEILPGNWIEIQEMGDYRDVITFRTSAGDGALGFGTASRIYLIVNERG